MFEGYALPGKTFNDCLPCKFLQSTNILGLKHVLRAWRILFYFPDRMFGLIWSNFGFINYVFRDQMSCRFSLKVAMSVVGCVCLCQLRIPFFGGMFGWFFVFWVFLCVFKRPGVAGAVLQTPLSLTDKLNNWLSQRSFSSRYSQYHKSQTVRARQLKFWENVLTTPCVMCHMSRVMCHVSRVTCHLSHVNNIFFLHFHYI